MSGSARVRRLHWAVGILGVVTGSVVVVVLVRLWTSADPNLAAWITSFVVYGVCYAIWELLDLSAAFRNASPRTQWLAIALALVLAIGGGLVYVLWPGSASWYLASLPAIPAFLILLSFPERDDSSRAGDVGDGPWTAP
jgi:hypothetical protein